CDSPRPVTKMIRIRATRGDVPLTHEKDSLSRPQGLRAERAVATQARAADYNFDSSPPSLAEERVGSAQASGGPRAAVRAPESGGVLDFLQLLARAVQQYHTYPPTSPLCRNAIE